MTSAKPAKKTARDMLIEWANDQSHWVRSIVREVLATNQALGDDVLDGALKEALAYYELSEDTPRQEPKLAPSEASEEQGEQLVIQRLGDVANVNRLAPGQAIEFNPRMTVLFGENATGKSGYVRILKRLAAVRSAEEILPDIDGLAKQARPAASIRYALGNREATHEWGGEAGVRPFTRASVFDSRAVAVHLEGDLTYAYTPGDLALFKHTHDAINAVRDRLEKARNDVRPAGNPFLPHFNSESTIYPKIETLGAATDLAALERLADISEEEQGGLQTLRSTVDALRSDTINTRLQVARSDKELHEALLAAGETIASLDWTAYSEGVGKILDLTEKLTAASQTAFEGENLPEALSEPWSAFIESADAYAKHLGQADYPHEGDQCLYCRQELGDAALALLGKYREYCNNTYRADRDQEAARLQAATTSLRALDTAQLRAAIERKITSLEESNELPPLLDKSRILATEIAGIIPRAAENQLVDASRACQLGEELRPLAKAQLETTEAQIVTLTTQGADREAALAKESAKLRELEDRLNLKQHLPQIRTHVENAKWANRADDLLRTRIRSLLRSLTDTSKLASEDLLNQDFERRFKEESEALRAPRVKLAFPGKRGEAARRKSLTASKHHLGDVLSEGEQKVIALADFLAECAIRTNSAPLIFDDPVNSLDYKRLEHIADRLFDLSKDHQVIVFTHSILLAMAIIDRFENEKAADDCAYFDVSRAANGAPGVVTGGKHPRYDTPKVLRGEINALVQDISKASGAGQQALIERGYSRLRSWCEAVVEEQVLAGVTQRFRRNVRMTVLPQIRGDRLRAFTEAILPLFEKACGITEAHAQPAEMLSVQPTATEFEEDWKAAQKALADYKA